MAAIPFVSDKVDYSKIGESLSFDELLVSSPSSTFRFRMKGDDMAPTILDGDIIVVDRALKARKNSLVLAIIDSQFKVSRFLDLRQGDQFWAVVKAKVTIFE